MIQVDGLVIYTVGKSHRTFNGMYEKSEGKERNWWGSGYKEEKRRN